MDGPRDCNAEWSKSDIDDEILYDIPDMSYEPKKKWYKWTYVQKRKRLTDLENQLVVVSAHHYI